MSHEGRVIFEKLRWGFSLPLKIRFDVRIVCARYKISNLGRNSLFAPRFFQTHFMSTFLEEAFGGTKYGT